MSTGATAVVETAAAVAAALLCTVELTRLAEAFLAFPDELAAANAEAGATETDVVEARGMRNSIGSVRP